VDCGHATGIIRPCSAKDRGAGHAASRRFVEQFPADQPASDFGCPCPDFIELGVAQEAACGVLVDIAVAAEELDGVEGHRERPTLLGVSDCYGRTSDYTIQQFNQSLPNGARQG
jgi:hypothetical protein